MLNLIRKGRPFLNMQFSKNFANERRKSHWDLYAGVLVERLPVISKTLNSMEQEFQSLLWQQEFEGSLKSNHELKHERDMVQAELIKKGELEVDLDDSASKQTAQDLKDAYVEEFKKFQFASRFTESDKKKDGKSTDRSLEESLYLLIERQIDDKKLYALPEGQRLEGETMRQTAERIFKENCGQNMNVVFYGNAPCAFYKYKYPVSMKNPALGAKVFLYRTCWKSGNIDVQNANNFEWHTKKEFAEKTNGTHMEILQKILF